jgi:formamidopyrimidine-DNA glycosylase
VLAGLGPDALGIGQGDLRRAVGGGRRAIKAALLDQSSIAGLATCWPMRSAGVPACIRDGRSASS